MSELPAKTLANDTAARRMIPGAYERRPTVPRQTGSVAGSLFGSADMPAGQSTMDAVTIAERQKEGGGGIQERRPRPGHAPDR